MTSRSAEYGLMFPGLDSIEAMEMETIEWIKGVVPNGVTVGFSGGKDSLVTEKLMELSGIKYNLVHNFTGLDAPEVVRFIKRNYRHCRIEKNKRTFWKELRVNRAPSDKFRWCCSLIKKYDKSDVVLGVRAEESPRRAQRDRANTYRGRTAYYPILYWKEWQIWEFIKKYSLPYPSLYDEGFSRIGCVVCPYHSEKTGRVHKMYRDRWPHVFERFEREIAKLYNKRVSQGKKMFYDSPEEFLDAWYKNDMARWYAA